MPRRALLSSDGFGPDPETTTETGSVAFVSSHVFSAPGTRQPTTSTYEKSPTGGGGLGRPGSTWIPGTDRLASAPGPGRKSVLPEHVRNDVEIDVSPRLPGADRGIVVAILV